MKKKIDWPHRIFMCVGVIALWVFIISHTLYSSADKSISSELLDKPVKEVSRDIFRSISEMPLAELLLWCLGIFIVIVLIADHTKSRD